MGGIMLRKPVIYALLCSWCCVASSNAPPDFDHGISLPTRRPLIIARGGASGMLPENTLPAYETAIEQGADILECDVSVTRDLRLVCLHEPWLSDVTDVSSKFQASRRTTRYITDLGKEVTDYFSVDFTLEELQTLKVKQRFNNRDYTHNFAYEIATLDQVLELVKSSSRPLGVYVETKHAYWVNSQEVMRQNQTTMEHLLVDRLKSFGCTNSTDPCFLQSFSLESLARLKELTPLPLVVLLDSFEVTNEELDEWGKFCYAIAPWKGMIVELTGDSKIEAVTTIVSNAHARGLKVHPFTFTNDGNVRNEMAWDYGQDPYSEYEHFLQIGVDGFFTDYPLTLLRFLNVTYHSSASSTCEVNKKISGSNDRSTNRACKNPSLHLFTLAALFTSLSMASTYLR